VHFLLSHGLNKDALAGRYIFLDNDFLSVIFSDGDALEDVLNLTEGSAFLMIDALTRFEFLRGVFLPARRAIAERFVDNEEAFMPAAEHPTIQKSIRDNSLILSNLYAHQKCEGASTVDLFLAGRVMLHAPKALIITGNRKDFPGFLFDIAGVLNYDVEKSGQVRAYSVIEFNKDKYDQAVAKWRALGE